MPQNVNQIQPGVTISEGSPSPAKEGGVIPGRFSFESFLEQQLGQIAAELHKVVSAASIYGVVLSVREPRNIMFR